MFSNNYSGFDLPNMKKVLKTQMLDCVIEEDTYEDVRFFSYFFCRTFDGIEAYGKYREFLTANEFRLQELGGQISGSRERISAINIFSNARNRYVGYMDLTKSTNLQDRKIAKCKDDQYSCAIISISPHSRTLQEKMFREAMERR